MQAGGLEVGRLRVQGDAEPLRLRQGVERLLGAADLVGSRLPPAAVLVVRTLRDPLPGRLDVASPGPDRVWEQRMREVLDDLVAGAARPAAGPPEPGAPAVVFADRAELLACAWRECLRSGRPSSWWWRALRLDDLPRVHAALAASPRQVPAALAHLDRTGELPGCVRLLAEREADALTDAVAREFGGPELVLVVTRRLSDAAPDPAESSSRRSGGASTAAVRPPAPPVVRSSGSLPRDVLVEVCRVLAPRHVPARVSSVAAERSAPLAEVPSADTVDEVTAGAEEAVTVVPTVRDEATDGSSAGAPGPSQHERAGSAPQKTHTRPMSHPGPSAGRSTPRPLDPDVDVSAHPAQPVSQPGAREEVPEASYVVDSRLGGVFHLVQVGQSLGLYGDFLSPAEPGIALDVWDFVSLTADALQVGLRRDPVWALLADLAGRDPSRPPGLGFRSPRTWRIPTAWLGPVHAPGPWRWYDGPRQSLVHPKGFPVVEGRGLDRERECARYGVVRCSTGAVDDRLAAYDALTARERWVHHLAAYLRVRLSTALGGPPSQAGRTLCRRPARVHVTATRVDVVSDLADLPIAVRLAGLDRDLGFVPAAGLTIGFGFR